MSRPNYPPQQHPPQQYPPQQGYPPQQYPPQQYLPQHGYPPQQYQPPPQHFVPTPVVSVNPNKFALPPGSKFAAPPGSHGQLIIKIKSASRLIAADSNGLSDPFVKIFHYNQKKVQSTKTISKTLNPRWEESFIIDINNPQYEIIVLEVFDKDRFSKDDPLGYVAINVSLLPKGIEVATHEKLSFVPHGEIEVSLTATNFGIIDVPATYSRDYVNWRNSLSSISKKGKEKALSHTFKAKLHASKKLPGPFSSVSIPPKGFSIVNDWVKKNKKD